MHVWGGPAWKRYVALALDYMGSLSGKSVLEIGFHDGEMSREFARRGAHVTAVEINRRSYQAVKPHPNVTFRLYDGDIDEIPGKYDFVFTKSVLVHAGLKTLPAIRRKLNDGGGVVFIENGKGDLFARICRRLARPGKSLAHLDYFTEAHIARIEVEFDIETRYHPFPPIYLVTGHTRAAIAPKVCST